MHSYLVCVGVVPRLLWYVLLLGFPWFERLLFTARYAGLFGLPWLALWLALLCFMVILRVVETPRSLEM